MYFFKKYQNYNMVWLLLYSTYIHSSACVSGGHLRKIFPSVMRQNVNYPSFFFFPFQILFSPSLYFFTENPQLFT